MLDNGGFAVINKLQNNTGNESFNNLFVDTPTIPEAFAVDFAAHAAAMGANAVKVDTPGAAWPRLSKPRKRQTKTSVIVMNVDAYEGWTDQGPHLVGSGYAGQVSEPGERSGKTCRNGKPSASGNAGAYDGWPVLIDDLLAGVSQRKNFVILGTCWHGYVCSSPRG